MLCGWSNNQKKAGTSRVVFLIELLGVLFFFPGGKEEEEERREGGGGAEEGGNKRTFEYLKNICAICSSDRGTFCFMLHRSANLLTVLLQKKKNDSLVDYMQVEKQQQSHCCKCIHAGREIVCHLLWQANESRTCAVGILVGVQSCSFRVSNTRGRCEQDICRDQENISNLIIGIHL